MPIHVTNEELIKMDLTKFVHLMNDNDRSEFTNKQGIEHYKLLAYFSTQFNGVNIIDIGTHRGSSALALSYNINNTVHSFDILDKVSNEIKQTSLLLSL